MKNFFICLCIPLFGLLSISTFAQTTFTGLVSDAWEDPGNWDNGLPGASSSVDIPVGMFVVISSIEILSFPNVSNYGTILIDGAIYNLNGFINNYGVIYNNGIIQNEGYFFNFGSIINNALISNLGEMLNVDGFIYNNFIIENNGVIDNYDNATIYNCFGSYVGNTVNGNPLEEINCTPIEVCDGVDNDLDGEIDEDCGCMDDLACNYNPSATLDDGGCSLPGCTTTLACNYNPSAGCDDGSCEYTSCAGCMDIIACNYNPLATIEDGTCEYNSCSGCTYASAVNYDSNAILDDGSCTFDQGGPNDSCSNDMNADGTVNAADLLIFLSAFGTSCE